MRNLVSALLAMLLIVSVMSISFARSAPQKDQVVAASQALPDVITTPAPVLQSGPPMSTGYDVICNLSTPKEVVTTTRRGRSTTGDRRIASTNYSRLNRLAPAQVLLN